MEPVSLIMLAAVFLTLVFSSKVGGLRKEIKAPATTGSEEFERAFRVHANTVEQLVLFLPSIWLATPFLPEIVAAAIGAVWIIGRILYARGYMQDPAKRGRGMWLTFLSMFALWIAALAGALGFSL